MATKMGYAPGTRIQIRDNSAYSVVENPNTVAGIVGYASKGELNKIIPVANTGELGTKLGYGYQSYKYNQGMYAANAVLMAGGEVEFVRPYGEEISRTDAYKRDLKTDCFVVAYDKNAGQYADNGAVDKKTGKPLAENSLNIKHFASTRYKTDGAAEFGVTRKINNIAETVATGKNVDFSVDASENFADSNASRIYDTNKPCTDMVLFSIMNRDPSNAYRAYDRYEVLAAEWVGSELDCTLANKPVFVIGDTVFLPCTSGKEINGKKGRSGSAVEATVTGIEDKKVTLSVTDEQYKAEISTPEVIIFSDTENAIADGFDYLNIKTAVAGSSVKNFTALKWGKENTTPKEVVYTGTIINLFNKSRGEYSVRLWGGLNPFAEDTVTVTTTETKVIVSGIDVSYLLVDDVLTLTFSGTPTATRDVIVTKITDDGVECSCEDMDSWPTGDVTVEFKSFASTDDVGVFKADIVAIQNDESFNNWTYVAKTVAGVIQSKLGFSKVPVANDIISVSGVTVKVDPSATYDYSIGDLVGIVRNSNNFESFDKVPEAAFDGNVYTVTGLNTMAGTITVNAKADLELEEGVDFQLINFTTTNATLYTATSNYDYTHDEKVTKDSVAVVVTTTTKQTIESAELAAVVAVGSTIDIVKDGTTVNFTIESIEGSVITGSSSATATISGATVTVDETDYTVTLTVSSETAKTITDSELATHAAESKDGAITLKKTSGSTTTTYTFTVESVKDSVITGTCDTITDDIEGLSAEYTYVKIDKFDAVDMYLVSSYTMYVSKADQKKDVFDVEGIEYLNVVAPVFKYDVDKSDVVLADSDIGASFMALGLAKTKFIDINFDGNPIQVYTLTDDGVEIARMFMSVRYRFNGTIYEFEGTVAPYNLNGRQLSIVEAAEYELEDSGLEFVINDSGVLEYFLENNSYDLSQTLQNGVLNGSMTAIAYNEDDPAIQNDAVWSYDPNNNNSGSTLSTVWNLFVNKDSSDVDMLVSAGIAVNSPFTRKYETLNTQVMQAMLNVCEARKDCFAIFDGLNEPDINKAQKKLIVADGFGSTHGRWGFLYDGRGVFQDSIYTMSQAEVMKSVQVASIITSNRQGGVFWIPAAGDEAYIPSAWGTKEKFVRSYNPEDKNCDHAKLSDIHVNATRVNKDGMRIFGDFTLQMEDTAFNQMHVTMLVAGLHKMFYKYLDHKVFKLNTTILRAQITSDLQDKLNAIIRQNPPGLINGKVICDDTNNTPEIIDQNYLIVDLKILPPKSTRWIILRTTVESTKNGKNISTTIVSE